MKRNNFEVTTYVPCCLVRDWHGTILPVDGLMEVGLQHLSGRSVWKTNRADSFCWGGKMIRKGWKEAMAKVTVVTRNKPKTTAPSRTPWRINEVSEGMFTLVVPRWRLHCCTSLRRSETPCISGALICEHLSWFALIKPPLTVKANLGFPPNFQPPYFPCNSRRIELKWET